MNTFDLKARYILINYTRVLDTSEHRFVGKTRSCELTCGLWREQMRPSFGGSLWWFQRVWWERRRSERHFDRWSLHNTKRRRYWQSNCRSEWAVRRRPRPPESSHSPLGPERGTVCLTSDSPEWTSRTLYHPMKRYRGTDPFAHSSRTLHEWVVDSSRWCWRPTRTTGDSEWDLS